MNAKKEVALPRGVERKIPQSCMKVALWNGIMAKLRSVEMIVGVKILRNGVGCRGGIIRGVEVRRVSSSSRESKEVVW